MRKFWWPMGAPPLPNHEEDMKNGWPWFRSDGVLGWFERASVSEYGDAYSLIYRDEGE